MPLFFIALFVGFGARQLRKSTQVPVLFRRLWLLGIALGLQVGVLPVLRGAPRRAVLFFSLAAAMAWLVDNVVRTNNKALRGALLLITVGAFMNIVPTLGHGAMPVDGEAARSIGLVRAPNDSAPGTKHVIVSRGSAQFFGDRFPIRSLHCVASIGDFVEMLGIALLVSALPKGAAQTKNLRPAHGPLTT